MDAAKIIDDAISEKKTISFEYDGESRIVQPHHYGSCGGTQQLHCYQVEGGSRSGKIPAWRNFKLEKMEKVAKNDNNFSPQPSYNPSKSHYEKIEKQVDLD